MEIQHHFHRVILQDPREFLFVRADGCRIVVSVCIAGLSSRQYGTSGLCMQPQSQGPGVQIRVFFPAIPPVRHCVRR